MSQNNHWCSVCGTGYYACDSCKEVSSFKPWRTITDTIEHYKIHLIVTDYNNGLIEKTEAKNKLAKLDYKLTDLKDGVQAVIKEIIGAESKQMNPLSKKK